MDQMAASDVTTGSDDAFTPSTTDGEMTAAPPNGSSAWGDFSGKKQLQNIPDARNEMKCMNCLWLIVCDNYRILQVRN